jgi:serine/threonine-protein kinase HipA
MRGDAVGSIKILIGADHAGDLMVYPDDRTEFSLARDYRALYPRPVLGQVFEDDLHITLRSRMRLPPFFSNLLPEERIRELIAAQLNVSQSREARLFAYLGEDLPGDIRAVPEGDLPEISTNETQPREPALLHPIKFSLAGAQPKLSMFRSPDGLTFPATGRGGDLLVKMPGSKFAGVPENEFATMSWAKASGIRVPDFWLEPISRLLNVPPELRDESGNAYVTARFDRPAPGKRVHMEDFAQILGTYPDYQGKYLKTNYESIANLIWQLHPPSFDEFLRRLVFVVMSGNADAHIKNWSLWYPDRVHAELSPAYDLVSTIEFIEKDELALNLAGSKAWTDVRVESFRQLARRIGADPAEVDRTVSETVSNVRDAWKQVRASASTLLVERIATHWARVPLATGK